jgi:hypothetical protein
VVSIEYDDGLVIPEGCPAKARAKLEEGRSPYCTPRGRRIGFYVRFPNGAERRLNIGYMRVSEMTALETVFNELLVNV